MNEARDMQFTLFVKNHDFIVRDYNLFKARVMPNITFLDLIYRFLISKGYEASSLELRNITFKNPVCTSEGLDVKLQINIKARKNYMELIARSQVFGKNAKQTNQWDENMQCTIHPVAESMEGRSLSLMQFKQRAERMTDLDAVYQMAREFEVNHLDFMKGKGTLYENAEQWIAQVSLTELADQYVDYFFMHPAFLDSAFVLFYKFLGKKIENKKPFLPIYIESFRVNAAIKNNSFIYLDIPNLQLIGEEALNANIEIYNSEGKVNAIFRGVSMKGIEENFILGFQDQKQSIQPEAFQGDYIDELTVTAKGVKELILLDLKKIASSILRRPLERISEKESFFKMGFDSKLILEFAYRLEVRLKRKINPTIIFGNPTIESLTGYVDKYLREVYEEQFKKFGRVERMEYPTVSQPQRLGESAIAQSSGTKSVEPEPEHSRKETYEQSFSKGFTYEEDPLNQFFEANHFQSYSEEHGGNEYPVQMTDSLDEGMNDQQQEESYFANDAYDAYDPLFNVIVNELLQMIGRVSGMNTGLIDIYGWDYSDGLSSDVLTALLNEISAKISFRISPAAVFRFKTIAELAGYLRQEHGAKFEVQMGQDFNFEPEYDFDNNFGQFDGYSGNFGGHYPEDMTLEAGLDKEHFPQRELLFILSASHNGELLLCADKMIPFVRNLIKIDPSQMKFESLVYGLMLQPQLNVRLAFTASGMQDVLEKLQLFVRGEYRQGIYFGQVKNEFAHSEFMFSSSISLEDIARAWVDGRRVPFSEFFKFDPRLEPEKLPEGLMPINKLEELHFDKLEELNAIPFEESVNFEFNPVLTERTIEIADAKMKEESAKKEDSAQIEKYIKEWETSESLKTTEMTQNVASKEAEEVQETKETLEMIETAKSEETLKFKQGAGGDSSIPGEETAPGLRLEEENSYVLGETKVLPFSHFLSEISENAQARMGKSFKGLKDIGWGAPVEEKNIARISTAIVEEEEELKFYVYSNVENQEDVKDCHLKGKLVEDARLTEFSMVIEDILSRLHPVSLDVYGEFGKVNAKIGDALKCIKSMHRNKNEVLAMAAAHSEAMVPGLPFKISVIEGVIQSIFALVTGGDFGDGNDVFVPYSCKEIFMTDVNISKNFYIHVKEILRIKKDGIVRFNAMIMDEGGNIVAKIKDFIFKIYKKDSWHEKIKMVIDESTITGEVNDMKNMNGRTADIKENEPIAIIGMAGLMPTTKDLFEFYENVISGKSMITGLPEERHDIVESGDASYIHSTIDGELFSGGYISNAEKFDAAFFKIEAEEARLMDPQQRLFMQVVWNAVEDAGYRMSVLSRVKTGVFVGAMSNDYYNYVIRRTKEVTNGLFSGLNQFYLANRISKIFDLKGPSEVVNTGHSSSISAIKRAIDELHNGGCEVAIAGASNLILNFDSTLMMDKLGLISRKGMCAPFERTSDGFLRSEGIGALVLKPLSKAIKNSDNVYAVIKGISVAHGGNAASLTFADAESQAEVIVNAWEMAGLNPFNSGYVELSAQGLEQEDKAEFTAIRNAFDKLSNKYGFESKHQPKVKLGSVKSFVGNMEGASGLGSLIHVLAGLKNRKKPGVLNLRELNPELAIHGTNFEVTPDVKEWENLVEEGAKVPRLAAVNSTGIGGVSGHIVLEEHLDATMAERQIISQTHMFVFSARNEERLKDYVIRFINFINSGNNKQTLNLEDVAYTLQIGREPMEERLAIITETMDGLLNSLGAYLHDLADSSTIFVGNIKANKTKFVPIFDGEEADAFVRLLMENKNYKNLAQLWILGIEFDWKQLHIGRKVKRASLPGYQFKGEYYWVDKFQKNKIRDQIEHVRQEHTASEQVQVEIHPDGEGAGQQKSL